MRGGDSYTIACACGAKLQGARQARHQVVRCPACGSGCFVLPFSALPDLDEPAVIPRLSRRRWPWLVAIALLAACLAAITLILLIGSREAPNVALEAPPTEQQLQLHQNDALEALQVGAYYRAARGFDDALRVADRLGRQPAAERRRLVQWQRQAALLSDLLAESPAEILRHAVGMPTEEWQEIVRRRYAGRALILDDTIARGPDGKYSISFRLDAGRIDLDRLAILREVPMTVPTRVLVGLRLDDVRRDSNGFAFIPEADSGVLLTDPELFVGLSLAPDAELREVLKRQRNWLDLP